VRRMVLPVQAGEGGHRVADALSKVWASPQKAVWEGDLRQSFFHFQLCKQSCFNL
jgi:hypothetical protein